MSVTVPSRVGRGLSAWFGRDPFRALRDEMDELLDRFSSGTEGEWPAPAILPSLDLSETADAYHLRMDLPGIAPGDIEIEVTGDTVRIHGERKEEKEEKGKTWHRIERRTGTFSRSVTLPASVKEDQVAAEQKDGVLMVTLPKTEKAKTHKVTIKPNGK